MDDLLQEATMFNDLTTTFTLVDVFMVIVSSFLSAMIIGFVYKKTHKGVSYSQSYVQNLVIMEITIGIVMLIIGSNIARAFSLVGALSIVRFRTAIKDPKDVGFIFMTMVAGMAFGTRFYLLGGIFTIMMALLIYILSITNFGSKTVLDKVLKIHVPISIDNNTIEECLDDVVKEYYLVSEDNISGDLREVVYIIEESKNNTNKIMEAIKKINGDNKVTIVTGHQKIDL